MTKHLLFLVLTCGVSACVRADAAVDTLGVDALVDSALPALAETYRHIHSNPELSHYEAQTAALLAERLRALGYEVATGIGKFDKPQWKGHGVVAILRNGAGPTALVRADMDALPLEEKTGLPYASKVKTKTDAGQEVGVMHACGHDIHVTTLIGLAQVLAQTKDRWRGTVMLVGQPAEETIDGAKAMLADGLYERFGRPDFAVALHDSSELEAGKVTYTSGYFLASATAIDIAIRGIGGHASRPESARDPIVLAAQVVLALQTIVSRENSPFDPVVLTIGSIHGGTRYNIIPDEVKLQLSLRTYREEVRQRILASIERIARNTALAAGVPDDRLPVVKASDTEVTPATYNTPALADRLGAVLKRTIGEENVTEMARRMGSEDFGRFGLDGHEIPTFMFGLGAVAPEKVAQSKQTGTPLPSLHSPLFYPLPEPTIRTGIKAMSAMVMELLKP
jgi:hippurate hydrolase